MKLLLFIKTLKPKRFVKNVKVEMLPLFYDEKGKLKKKREEKNKFLKHLNLL